MKLYTVNQYRCRYGSIEFSSGDGPCTCGELVHNFQSEIYRALYSLTLYIRNEVVQIFKREIDIYSGKRLQCKNAM